MEASSSDCRVPLVWTAGSCRVRSLSVLPRRAGSPERRVRDDSGLKTTDRVPMRCGRKENKRSAQHRGTRSLRQCGCSLCLAAAPCSADRAHNRPRPFCPSYPPRSFSPLSPVQSLLSPTRPALALAHKSARATLNPPPLHRSPRAPVASVSQGCRSHAIDVQRDGLSVGQKTSTRRKQPMTKSAAHTNISRTALTALTALTARTSNIPSISNIPTTQKHTTPVARLQAVPAALAAARSARAVRSRHRRNPIHDAPRALTHARARCTPQLKTHTLPHPRSHLHPRSSSHAR
eukprot:6213551-Pleurochrysis_carterae.AAC.3